MKRIFILLALVALAACGRGRQEAPLPVNAPHAAAPVESEVIPAANSANEPVASPSDAPTEANEGSADSPENPEGGQEEGTFDPTFPLSVMPVPADQPNPIKVRLALGSGLYVSGPAGLTEPFQGTGEGDFRQRCNASDVPGTDKPGRVAAVMLVKRGDFVSSISVGCKEVTKTGALSLASEMSPEVGGENGTPQAMVAPQGFAFSGFAVRTCRHEGKDVVGGVKLYAKRVESWGLNDDIEWESRRAEGWEAAIGGFSCSEWTDKRCENGSVLTGFNGRAGDTVESLVGVCQPVRNALLQKPQLVSVKLEESESLMVRPALMDGEAACAMTCPEGTYVSGMRYGRSIKSDEGTYGVSGAILLCRSVDPTQPLDVDLYETQGTCGGDHYEYSDYSQKFSSRNTFFPGFGAHAIRLKLSQQYSFSAASIRSMWFDQTPIDRTREFHPVWVGAQKQWSFPSYAAGNAAGTDVVLECPGNKIVTGIEFSQVAYGNLSGIKSYTCAGVKVDL